MMKNGKGFTRALAWLLTLVMLVGCMPAAMADGQNHEYTEGQVYYIEDVAYICIGGELVKLTPAPTATPAPTPAPVEEKPVDQEKAQTVEAPAAAVETEQKTEETGDPATLELPLGPAIAQVERTLDEEGNEQIEVTPVTPAPETEEDATATDETEEDATVADETEEDAIVEDETAQDEANKPQLLPGFDLSGLMPKIGAEKDEETAKPEEPAESEDAGEESEPQTGFPGSGFMGVLIGKLETVLNDDGEEEYTIVPVTPDPDATPAAPVETPVPEEAGDDYGIALLSLIGDGKLPASGCTKNKGGAHKWVIDSSNTEKSYSGGQTTESTHTINKTTTVTAHCANGCSTPGNASTTEVTVEPHKWDGGQQCTVCKYENECKHTGPKYVDYTVEADTGSKITYNKNTHNLKGWIVTTKTCIECGKVVSREWSSKKTISGPHDFVGGTCYCGYAKGTTCEHDNVVIQKEVVSCDAIEQTNAWKHTYVGATIYEYQYCKDCGRHLNYENPRISNETKRTEEHDFAHGVCTVCGYKNTCKHEDGTYPYEEFGVIYNVKSNGAKTHSFTAYVTTYKICRDCGEIRSVSTKSNKKFTKNHKFRHGKCTVCGARQGAVATATPEVYRADEMATMLVNAAVRETTNIGVTVEILGTDQILTADEMLRYNALTPQEKVLVTFAAIGMEMDTTYAKNALNIMPAPATVTLIADIAARQLRMTAEEKAALQQTVAEYFPVETDMLGVKRIQVTVSVTSNGVATAQRYTFRYDNLLQIWLFEKAEAVADEYVGIK